MKFMVILLSLVFSLSAQSQLSCGANIQGGVDLFPWSQDKALPFAWSTIQGLWKVNSDSDMIMRFKVTRQSAQYKQLEVEIFSRKHCSAPLMSGIGIITEQEKNVIRVNIDGKLMKLGWFRATDLNFSPETCGQKILAASFIDLSDERSSGSSINGEEGESVDVQNMMLKKITNSTNFYCKKRN